jgi:hypothetical protein
MLLRWKSTIPCLKSLQNRQCFSSVTAALLSVVNISANLHPLYYTEPATIHKYGRTTAPSNPNHIAHQPLLSARMTVVQVSLPSVLFAKIDQSDLSILHCGTIGLGTDRLIDIADITLFIGGSVWAVKCNLFRTTLLVWASPPADRAV